MQVMVVLREIHNLQDNLQLLVGLNVVNHRALGTFTWTKYSVMSDLD